MPVGPRARSLLIVLGLALGALPAPGAAQDPVADFLFPGIVFPHSVTEPQWRHHQRRG